MDNRRLLSRLSGSKVRFSFGFAHDRYQRDEIFSVEKCEELKRRIDKEISDVEKRAAARRKE